MVAVDVVSMTTGEVLRCFDLPWFDQGKRHIKGWIKANGYVFDHVEFGHIGTNENTTVWVKED